MEKDQLRFWSGEPHANPSPSPDSAKDWTILVVTWPSRFLHLLTDCGPSGWFGRTSPECCRQTKDGRSVPLSGAWANSGMGGPTESLTLNTSEYPSVGVVCSLSDILETGDVPQRFFLSAKACRGILRRAAKRGKKLPEPLQLALEAAGGTKTLT